MLQSLFQAVAPEEFHKFYFVVDGTTNTNVLNFLHDLKLNNPFGVSGDKFDIIVNPLRQGVARSLNQVIRKLDADESLFLLPNTVLFEKNFFVNLVNAYLGHPRREEIFTMSAVPLSLSMSPAFHVLYHQIIRTEFLRGIDPHKGLALMESLFRQFTKKSVDELMTEQVLQVEQIHSGDFNAVALFLPRCFQQAGFFDEQFCYDKTGEAGGFGEDFDYASRITELNGLNLITNKSLYYIISSSGSSSLRGEESNRQREEKFYQKYVHQETFVKNGDYLQRVLTCGAQRDFVLVGSAIYAQHHNVRMLEKNQGFVGRE